ncbi:MAG: hypothetical protein ABIQ40_17755 [Bacteroidia bacterium]
MKKQFFGTLLFFLFLHLTLAAQKKEEQLLPGTWESNGITINGTYYSTTDGTTVISFYKNGTFQDYLFGCDTNSEKIKCDTFFIRTGQWELTKKMHLNYSDYYYDRSTFFLMDNSTRIASINDSELVISSSGKNPDYFYHYRRIASRKEIIITLTIPFVASDIVASADTIPRFNYFLVNSADSSIKIKIDKYSSNSDFYTKIFTPDSMQITRTWYSGPITTLNDTSIVIRCRQENSHTYLEEEDAKLGETTMSYNGFYEPTREIKLNSISSFRYSSTRKESAFTTGALFTFIASFSTLVIAPLVSIKYSQGGFNTHRYFLWTGAGLCALGVSVPIMIFTHPKTYLISSKNSPPNKKHWYFAKQSY